MGSTLLTLTLTLTLTLSTDYYIVGDEEDKDSKTSRQTDTYKFTTYMCGTCTDTDTDTDTPTDRQTHRQRGKNIAKPSFFAVFALFHQVV